MCKASLAAVFVLLLDGPPSAALTCPSRSCLPDDGTEGKSSTLCYTNTGGEEAFANCPGEEANKCVKCSTEPPCESFCEQDTYTAKELGETCHFDRDCGIAGFTTCHLGLCRRVVWTSQKCDEDDVHSTCLFGAQACVTGRCGGLGTNQPCWDGYSDGTDLDCQIGWYCLRGICVPQLPNGHTCYGEHPDECSRGHRCNLSGDRPQCTEEYSLKIGMRSSTVNLCSTSHISPRTKECAEVPKESNFGKDCSSDADCSRSDNSPGNCRCKQWWDGYGAPGYCEMIIPDMEKPSFMEFWRLRKLRCHHNWPPERCALELGEDSLHLRVLEESQASADPTVIAECGYQALDVVKATARRNRNPALAWLLLIIVSNRLYSALYA